MLAQIFRRTLLATLILATSLIAFATEEGEWWNCNSLLHPLIRVEGVRMPTHFMPLIETPRLLIGWTIPSEGEADDRHFQPLNPQNPGSLEVLTKDGFRVIGTIHISPFTKGASDGAHIPLGFNRDVRARGVGTEAKFAALKYAFEVLHVQFVYATIFDDNYASLALHEKLGFVDDDPDHPHRSPAYSDGQALRGVKGFIGGIRIADAFF